MCDKCVELRAKIEQMLGDKLTDSEFTGVKVIAALGADTETIVDVVKTHRNPEKEGLSENTKAAIDEVVEALASVLRNGGIASPDDVTKILGRKMTEIEETKGYTMAKEGKSAEEIAAALQGESNQAVNDVEADLPDDIKKLLAQARADGAEVKVVRIDLDEDDQYEDKDEAVEVIAIAMFDEDGTPVSVDMVKYEDFLELEETAVDAVEALEEAGEEIKKLQAQITRFKQLRDAVGEFANKTFAAESGEAVRAGHFLSKEVLHMFPDLYK